MKPTPADRENQRRWLWLLPLLALLMSVFCVYSSTYLALSIWPTEITQAQMLAENEADYGRDPSFIQFAPLSPQIILQATKDSLGLSVTPTPAMIDPSHPPVINTPVQIAGVVETPTRELPTAVVSTATTPRTTPEPATPTPFPPAATSPTPTIDETATATTTPTDLPPAPPTSTEAPTAAPPSQAPSPTPIVVVTSTPINTPAPTATNTPIPTSTPTVSITATPTPSSIPSATPSTTATATNTPSPTVTPTASPSPSATPTNTPTPTPSPMPTYMTIRPILECVQDNGDGTFDAHFGYLNENSYDVTIPVGSNPNNKFQPAPEDRGQPTLFLSGRHYDVFTVPSISNSTNLNWQLDGRITTASPAGPGC